MPQGYLCLVLHAHLPFVRHPEYEDFLEEDWLYEAITETYLPLLEMMDGLERDNVDWRLTMSVTPPLAAMLNDELLQNRYVRHIDNLLALMEKELVRTRTLPEFKPLAEFYHRRFGRCRELFVEKYQRNLLNGFRHHFQGGKLELITCGATHGFLPLMPNAKAAKVQVELGASEFERHFGKRPQGIWLAECGYREGVDELLAESGIKYFFVDTHGVMMAHPRPRFGVYAPIVCPTTGVAALARDMESSKQVWSSVEGYPGDFAYREFYRDAGFDLDFEYMKDHLHEIGVRTNVGVKYYKITGKVDLNAKEPYDRPFAERKAKTHAADFLFNRERQIEWLASQFNGRPPIVVAPYDAELFGHWWYEGPEFLDGLFRAVHDSSGIVAMTTVPDYMALVTKHQIAAPSLSTWGAEGYCKVWLEPSNDWIYPHLHELADRMEELAGLFPEPDALQRRTLNQAARELLLAQSSDWAFIMKTGTMVEYAHKRTLTHVLTFNHFYDQLKAGSVDETFLKEVEERHTIFPTIDYRMYA